MTSKVCLLENKLDQIIEVIQGSNVCCSRSFRNEIVLKGEIMDNLKGNGGES